MLLTIDIGTSSFKSALWDFEGRRHSFYSVPLFCNDIKHETDPACWLRAFNESCAKLKPLDCVQALVISGNGPSLVPVLGEPVYKNEGLYVPAENARLWLDRRAEKYQDEVTDVMQGFVDASFFLPKILYIKNEENELYKKTKFFLGCPEYLAYALTGMACTVIPCDGFERWFWNDSALDNLNLDNEKFPCFIRPGDKFGELTPQAAMMFGFKKNVPVISGGPDFFAAILGSGVTKQGQACDRTGSSEGINLCTGKYVSDKRLMSYSHPVKPFWNLSGIINTTGKAIDWVCGLLQIDKFDDFIALAQKSKPGSGGLVFLPYLAGERAPIWDPLLRSCWQGISLSSGRSEFANSVLEGIGFAIRDVITAMNDTGNNVMQLHVTGGLAGCGALNQIKADITGIQVQEGVQKEAELLGLAIIGSCFLGRFSSYQEASCAMYCIEKQYEPDFKNKTLYDELFEKYLSLGKA
jgi:xylulokinase